MYSFPRVLKFRRVTALTIYVILAVICLRIWSTSNSNVQQQVPWGQFQHENLQNHSRHPFSALYDTKEQQKLLHSFKVPKGLEETHDIAIPRDIPPWTEADSAWLNTTPGFDMMSQLLKLEYSRTEEVVEVSQLDWALSARAERYYKSLWNYLYPVYQSLPGVIAKKKERIFTMDLAKTRPEVDFFLRLERKLYPWLNLQYRTSFSLYDSYDDQKGFVYCAGNRQFGFVVASIQALRKLQPDIPIQVFYMGDKDLSPEKQKYVREMTNNIEVVDITQLLDNSYTQLVGFSIKPFALLVSRFSEAMLIDADAFFLRDPAELFDDPGYKATGALFFYDRTVWEGKSKAPDWLRSMMPIMSSFPPTTRLFRSLSQHEQESGVVVMNKKERLQGLLAACKMNSKWERDLWSYKITVGDKETFWIGFEMVQEPYAFVKSYGGVIGEMREKKESNIDVRAVCGPMLHLDHMGRLMWWNGGLMRAKHMGITRAPDFRFWISGGGLQTHRERIVRDQDQALLRDLWSDMDETTHLQLEHGSRDPEWLFLEGCLVSEDIHELDQTQKGLANAYLRINRIGQEDERKLEEGQTVNPKDHDWENV
ncbi:hypothetical protein BGX28_005074 [Mortierella sp. GBA30]|nr:hypothetical protein BGX28_005074 [Mortierella sp. GBA30]